MAKRELNFCLTITKSNKTLTNQKLNQETKKRYVFFLSKQPYNIHIKTQIQKTQIFQDSKFMDKRELNFCLT